MSEFSRKDAPRSQTQRWFDRLAPFVLVTSGLMLGILEAVECAKIRFGYSASYAFAAALFWGFALVLSGFLLLIFWRTRRTGVGLSISGLLSVLTFYSGIAVLTKMDRVAWRHEPPLRKIGPDVKSSAVIYFRKGTSEQDVEAFRLAVLYRPQGPGSEGGFLKGYLRLLPDQANGHEAIALDFDENASPAQVESLLKVVGADRRVERIYREVAPAAIH